MYVKYPRAKRAFESEEGGDRSCPSCTLQNVMSASLPPNKSTDVIQPITSANPAQSMLVSNTPPLLYNANGLFRANFCDSSCLFSTPLGKYHKTKTQQLAPTVNQLQFHKAAKTCITKDQTSASHKSTSDQLLG